VRRWLHRRGLVALACALAASAACVAHGSAPGRDLDALARALGRRADGSLVAPADIRWEPSGGIVSDLLVGRWVLFLARAPGEENRDVWRCRARVAPDGSVVDIAGAHDLTNTPLGDDHALVVHGRHAAFATRVYGQEQSVTILSLDGEGDRNKAATLSDRAMTAVTNLQRTGATEGVGRLDLTFESPGRDVALRLGETTLELTLFGGDARHSITASTAQVDLGTGELTPSDAGMRAEASMHLPKRFSHWAVDTLRAVSWIGPAPIAWVEDQALSLRDTYRRLTFRSGKSQTDVVVIAKSEPPALDPSEAQADEAHWPPPHVPSIWKSSEPGEGEWSAPPLSWLHRPVGVAADAPAAFYETFVRPDEERPYAKVLLVAMDMRQLELDMEAGVEDPEPLTGPPGAGRIPRDPSVYRRVVAAFNGAFKTEHGHYGMMVHKRVLLPPVPAAATVVVLDDARVGFGTWGSERKVGGIVGVPDDAIVSFRQNLDPLIDHGQINPAGRNLWGFTLPGKGVQTERSGLCVTGSGHLIYAWGDDVSATSLGRAMSMAGCDYAIHLDMNPYHTGFLFTAIDDLPAKKYRSSLLTAAMSIPTDRYIQYAPKDFFYVLNHDAPPPGVPGASPWVADGGLQPPPQWLPGVWSARSGGASSAIDLVDVEPSRATWRIRAGSSDAIAASPLREIAADDAKRVLLAVGLGVAPDRRPLGFATDGHMAVALRGGDSFGVLVVSGDGRMTIFRADDAPALGPHDDLVELPLALWDGERPPVGAGAPVPRAALGIAPSGRVLVARGVFSSIGPLVDALSAAGCSRAVVLDRGLRATGLLDRAGTDRPPRGQYEESVVYAIGTPLRPRGFRFEPSALVAQAGRSTGSPSR